MDARPDLTALACMQAAESSAVMQRHLDETTEDARTVRKKLKEKLAAAVQDVEARRQEVGDVTEELEIKTAELKAAQVRLLICLVCLYVYLCWYSWFASTLCRY